MTIIGEMSFKHYGCVVNGSLFVDNIDNPLYVLIKPHSNRDELGERITFSKINGQWLTEYSLPVLHNDTYQNIVERIMEFIYK